MKKIIIIIVAATSVLFSCNPAAPKKSSLFVSSNAYDLIDSYRDLINKNYIKNCDYEVTIGTDTDKVKGNREMVTAAMSAKGFLNGAAGYTSFLSYRWNTYSYTSLPTKDVKWVTAPFYSIWFGKEDSTRVLGIRCDSCKPNPIVYPYNASGVHTFLCVFVPVETYKTSGLAETTPTSDNSLRLTGAFLPLALNCNDITAINEVYMEDEGGYMNQQHADKYSNVNSSIGLVCDVVLKSGEKKTCYIFNNVDGGKLLWKNKK
jgi:hypothetical protein